MHILDLKLWNDVINLQKDLDAKIIAEKNLTLETTMNKRVLALLVELSEFSNELRCFKYWSTINTYKSFTKLLDEYVDCLHFIVSLGLVFNINLEKYTFKKQSSDDLTLIILNTMDAVLKFWKQELNDYEVVLNYFFTIAFVLKIDFVKIHAAYLEKNNVNHQRIINNY